MADRKAIISPNLNLSYADPSARRTVGTRTRSGVVAGTNIGICLRDNAETLVLMIAGWMLGATAVPMDFRTNAAERSLLAREFDLGAIVEDRQVSAAGYTPVFAGSSWAETIAKHDGSPVWPNSERAAAPAFISLTSGTTGRPKGIVIDHGRMLLRSTFDAERLEGPLLNPLPLSFSASRTHVFSALLQGSGVYLFPMLFWRNSWPMLYWSAKQPRSVASHHVRNLFDIVGERSTPIFAKLEALYRGANGFGRGQSQDLPLREFRSSLRRPAFQAHQRCRPDLDAHPTAFRGYRMSSPANRE